MEDITPRKRNRILTRSERCNYTQTANANIVLFSDESHFSVQYSTANLL